MANNILRDAAATGDVNVIIQNLSRDMPDYYSIVSQLLIVAAENGHLNVVQYLCNNGADVRWRDSCAFRTAAEKGHVDIVRYLNQRGAEIDSCNNGAVKNAAAHGHLDVIKYLYCCRADITQQHGPLMLAAEYGYLDIVQYLCKKGANESLQSNEALKMAICNNHLSIVRLLLKNGGNIDDPDFQFVTENKKYIHVDNQYVELSEEMTNELTSFSNRSRVKSSNKWQ